MTAPAITRLDLKVGDIVEVRSEAEILATLDADGALDALPFMPEMLQYAGKRLAVGKIAHMPATRSSAPASARWRTPCTWTACAATAAATTAARPPA